MRKRVIVEVPASSGNIGPGFDVLGMALKLRNRLEIRVLGGRGGGPVVKVFGEGSDVLPSSSKNIIAKAVQFVFKQAKKKAPKLELLCENQIPLARGLGSSAAATVSGLLGANALLNKRFSLGQILTWASRFEGHPDNVAPALFGGIQASGIIGKSVVSSAWPVPDLGVVVAVPEFKLSTKKARKILPTRVPLKDAVSNIASVALMKQAFENKTEWLKELLNDRLHEPYRAKLIPGFFDVKKAALQAGSYGVTLSGAGPTVLSFVSERRVSAVSVAMGKAFKKHDVRARIIRLGIDRIGALVR